nr:MAG: hypothetical protein [Flaviviridae sp.]
MANDSDEARARALRENLRHEERQARAREEERRRFRKKAAVFSWLEPWMDPWSLEFVIDVVIEAQYGPRVISLAVIIGYSLLTLLAIWLINRISRYISFAATGTLYWMSLPAGNIMLFLTLVQGINLFRRRKLEEVYNARGGAITPWQDLPSKARGDLVLGWLDPMVLNVLLIMVVALIVGNTNASMAGMVAMLIMVVLMRLIPGVGGNSTTGLISIVLIIIVAVAMTPPVFGALLDMLRDKVRETTPGISLGAVHTTSGVLSALATPGSLWEIFTLEHDSFCDALRVIIGNVVIIWSIIDDFRGPGKALDTTTEIRQKKDRRICGGASIDTGVAWIMLGAQVMFEIYNKNIMHLTLRLVSGFVTWALWEKLGSSIWVGRGQGATLTDARSGFGMIFGSGAGGRRLLVMRVGMFLAVALYTANHFNNVGMAMTYIYFICMFTERPGVIALAVLTHNLPLFWMGVFSRLPLTGTLQDSTRDAGQGTIGGNSGGMREPG